MEVFHVIGRAPLYTNTFLLVGNAGGAVLVDPAAAPFEYEKLMQAHNAALQCILLTHGHHDHVGAVQQLAQEAGVPVYLGEGDADGSQLFPLTGGTTPVQDGQSITVDDMTFRVLATPGHSRGSVCYLCGDLLFCGDTLFAGDIGRCDLDGGSYSTMLQSLAKLKAAVPDETQVLPGHGTFSTMAAEKESNPYLNGEIA